MMRWQTRHSKTSISFSTEGLGFCNNLGLPMPENNPKKKVTFSENDAASITQRYSSSSSLSNYLFVWLIILNNRFLCCAGMTQRPYWRCFRNYQITLIPSLIGMNWWTKLPLVFLMPENIRCYGAAWRMVIPCPCRKISNKGVVNLWSVSYSFRSHI